LGLDEHPAEVDGIGSVPALTAIRVAADATTRWRLLITSDAGNLLDYGRTLRRPPQELIDFILAANPTCRFPGCPRRSRRCDLDHLQAWQDDGSTSAANLRPCCPRHHAAKHEAGWQPVLLGDGTLRWTSPIGNIYDDPPARPPADTTATHLTGSGDDPPPPF
jgi:hypothetical protein